MEISGRLPPHQQIHQLTGSAPFQDAGFEVDVIPDQGAGAAMMRVEAVRRVFPRCWFNEKTTEAGREALGYYHERKDEARNIGLGPEHDWSSYGCDAFGLMAIVYEEPAGKHVWRRNEPPSAGQLDKKRMRDFRLFPPKKLRIYHMPGIKEAQKQQLFLARAPEMCGRSALVLS
jgi:hypothetical protein